MPHPFSFFLSVALSVSLVLGLIHWMPTAQPVASFTDLRVATYKIEGDFGHCSAVMVAPGVLLTAAHCEDNAKKLSGSNLPIKFLRKDESRDLMLLQVAKGCPCVKMTFEEFVQDEPVVQIGYPEASGVQVLTEGRIQSAVDLRKFGNYKQFAMSTAAGAPGSSGGPVFVKRDGQWKVGGLVSFGTIGSYQGMYPYIVTHLMVISTPQSLHNFIFRTS